MSSLNKKPFVRDTLMPFLKSIREFLVDEKNSLLQYVDGVIADMREYVDTKVDSAVETLTQTINSLREFVQTELVEAIETINTKISNLRIFTTQTVDNHINNKNNPHGLEITDLGVVATRPPNPDEGEDGDVWFQIYVPSDPDAQVMNIDMNVSPDDTVVEP